MKFILNIKPTIITGRTKREVLSKAGLSGFVTQKHFSGYSSHLTSFSHKHPEIFSVVNLIKQRKKSKQVSKDATGVTKSIILKQAGWTGYLYKIPEEILVLLNLKLQQNPRNFKLIKIK